MIRHKGDMWTAWPTAGLFLVTTNSYLNQRGELVMGRGMAWQARRRFGGLPKAFGEAIAARCGHLGEYGLLISERWPEARVGALQVKRHWVSRASLSLIRKSTHMLSAWAEEHPDVQIHLNMPGVGNGRRSLQEVLPIMEVLPDNVHVWVARDFDDRPLEEGRYLAFDVEIPHIPEERVSEAMLLDQLLRPGGISCAATLRSDGQGRIWHGAQRAKGKPLPVKMSVEECDALASYLIHQQGAGYPTVSWNGMGFDLPVLRRQCSPGMSDAIISLALGHVDMAFHLLCVKGYMIGLDTACRGMKLSSGKTEGMNGELAMQLWGEGREAQKRVLGYVQQDARLTAELYQALCQSGRLEWTSRSGKANSWSFDRLLTVEEALALPKPATSWMSREFKEQWAREKFTGWIGREHWLIRTLPVLQYLLTALTA
jgi:hypothetical protein